MFTRVKRNRACKGATDKNMLEVANLGADDGTMPATIIFGQM
jgi:hypothetical protein